MSEIIGNVRAILPFAIFFWALLLISVARGPQRFRNCILLMFAGYFTMLMIAGLFGDLMGFVLLIMFLFVMLALFLVPSMLIFNGIQMLKKESRSLGNLLSLLLGLAVGAGEIATILFMLGAMDIGRFTRYYKIMGMVGFTVFYFSTLMLAFVLYTLFIQYIPHRTNFNYIIIHGCGLIRGREISKLLASRLDKAIELYGKCREKPILIPSGGKGSDEAISEAEAMAGYLREHGIPDSQIIMEDKSVSTMENLIFSKNIVYSREGKKRMALITSNYHVYRCLSYAKSLSMKCVGIGAKVAWYYWPSALIREFVAVFSEKKYLILIGGGYLVMAAMLALVFSMT